MNAHIYNKVGKWMVLAAALVAMPSCSDFLDKEPDERVIITNLDQVIKLLGTGYSTANYGWICEVSSDNVIDVNAPFKAPRGSSVVHYNLSSYERGDEEAFRFEPVKSSTGTDSPSDIWEACYHAIAVANHALVYLDEIRAKQGNTEMSEQMKAAYAEAYLIRAYHHFILVNVFSQAYKDEVKSADITTEIGVPYTTTIEENLICTYDRPSVKATYDAIEADLLKGLAWVSDINYKMPKWHFNVNAAHAFAARFYLFKRQYDKVIAHADSVLGTDYSTLPAKLMSYERFDSCTTGTDYAEIWQGPSEANNLLLIATYSVQMRRQVGQRFACAGDALKCVLYHGGPDHNWTGLPTAFVAGETFYDGTADHGFTSSRIYERFEYTDKVAGIGYAHTIRREFTANELLLERAEAKILTGKYNEACQDLIAYEDSRFSFSAQTKSYYDPDQLTQSMIEDYYAANKATAAKPNSKTNWDFTQELSSSFVIAPAAFTYMNCLNDFRRYETAYTGLRFFDLKRWGEPYKHTFRIENSEDTISYESRANSVYRAIEVPQEVLAADMQSSRPASSAATKAVLMKREDLKRESEE